MVEKLLLNQVCFFGWLLSRTLSSLLIVTKEFVDVGELSDGLIVLYAFLSPFFV